MSWIQTILGRFNLTTQQAYKLAALSLCGFVFVLTCTIIMSETAPIGSDSYFHLQLSRYYGEGNFTAAFDFVQRVNQMPFYPPLYHILIMPLAVSPDPYTGLRVLEILFLPITFALITWVTWKLASPKAALIAGLVLMGSWSFLDGAIQARPESLDLMLYPLIVYAAVVGRKKLFALATIVTIYGHGLAALTNMIGIAAKKFFEKNTTWRKTLLITLAISLPILIISAIYFPNAFSMWSTYRPTENPQEALFWEYPPWIPYYAGITLMGFAFTIRKAKSEFESILKWGLLGNLIMLPFWADRWLQYSSIPLAMLVGVGISRWHGWKLYIVLFAIALGSWIYISNFLLISFFSQWWQPERYIWGLTPPI